MLPVGSKGKGRQKAREDPEELDAHLLIWGWGLNSGWQRSWECFHPPLRRSSSKAHSPASVKERTTAGPAQASSSLCGHQPLTTADNKKLSSLPALLLCFLFSTVHLSPYNVEMIHTF